MARVPGSIAVLVLSLSALLTLAGCVTPREVDSTLAAKWLLLGGQRHNPKSYGNQESWRYDGKPLFSVGKISGPQLTLSELYPIQQELNDRIAGIEAAKAGREMAEDASDAWREGFDFHWYFAKDGPEE